MTYPLITWQFDSPTFTVDVRVTRIAPATTVTETIALPAAPIFGWLTTGTEAANNGRQAATASGNVARAISNAVIFHSSIASLFPANKVGLARYGTRNGVVGWWLNCDTLSDGSNVPAVSDVTITATSNVAALARYGIRSLPATLYTSLVGPFVASNRTDGVWRPGVDGTRLEPVYTAAGSGAWSPYDATYHDRIRVGDRVAWSCLWPFVSASDITREVNGLADYLPLAGRGPTDVLGTLDDVVVAASQDRELSLALTPIGTAAVNYRACILPVEGDLSRGDYTTEASVGSRRYNVSMALLEATNRVP